MKHNPNSRLNPNSYLGNDLKSAFSKLSMSIFGDVHNIKNITYRTHVVDQNVI